MTKQIQPIDTSVNTWGDVISRVNEVIDAANTDFVTLDATNNGSIGITGTFSANVVNTVTANTNSLTADTVTTNTANVQSASISTANVGTLVANLAVSNTVNANNVVANVATVAVANVGTLSANIATVATLTVNTISSFTANVATVSALASNVANITTINSNTTTANLVYTTSIRVNGKTNLDKLSAADFPPNHAITTDVDGNIVYQPVSNFGRTFMGTTNAETARLQLALDRINNTSDAEKPISTLVQAALDLKVNAATRVTAGTGLSGGGALTANVTLSLSANSIASLAKADSAIQANSTALVPSGGLPGQILTKTSSDPFDFGWATSALTTAVQFIPQSLSPTEQAQARENLGLGTALSDYVRRDGNNSPMTGEFVSAAPAATINHRFVAGGTSALIRYDGATLLTMFSDTVDGSWNTLRPLQIEKATGKVTTGNGLLANSAFTANVETSYFGSAIQLNGSANRVLRFNSGTATAPGTRTGAIYQTAGNGNIIVALDANASTTYNYTYRASDGAFVADGIIAGSAVWTQGTGTFGGAVSAGGPMEATGVFTLKRNGSNQTEYWMRNADGSERAVIWSADSSTSGSLNFRIGNRHTWYMHGDGNFSMPNAVYVNGGIIKRAWNVRGGIEMYSDNGVMISYSDDNNVLFAGGTEARMIGRQGGAWYWTLNSDNGEFWCAGNVVAYSDERVKKNIKPIENALEKVLALEGVTYDKRSGENGEYRAGAGFIAQKTREVAPELVYVSDNPDDEFLKKGEEPSLSLDMGNGVNAYLVEAIRALNAKIEALEARVTELEGR